MGTLGGGPRGGRRTDFFDLGTLLAPSWAQLAPQMAPRPSKNPSWGHPGTILVAFWCHFGAILVPFWAQAGWKNVPTWLQNSFVKSIRSMSQPTARWQLVGAAGG